MSLELFVYWHALPARQTAAESAAQALQAELRDAHPGLVARLYRRSQGDRVTVMETYATATGLSLAQQAAILVRAEHALGVWCDGPRHVECFEALAAVSNDPPAAQP